MKKSPVRLIVDLNGMLNAALLGGKDPDGEMVTDPETGKVQHVNTALYGVERFFDALLDTMNHFGVAPKDCIGVWDGLGAKSFRQTMYPPYKQGRDKASAVHIQLGMARDMLAPMLRQVGFTVCSVKAREADDVIARLVRDLRDRPNVVSTGDGDLCVLVDPNTHVWKGGELNKNPFGAFPHRYITLYKALVGDTSDNIPGARGFGDASFVELVRIFGLDGLEMLEKLILSQDIKKLREDVSEFPKLQKIIDSEDLVYKSWQVARLMPDEVATKHHAIDWVPAMAMPWNEVPEEQRIPQMKHWYGTKTLVTALNYASARSRFKSALEKTEFVSLDIETSSGEASDEWLEYIGARGKKVDVLGAELTGMSLTFGDNLQHTVYMSVNHADTENISVDQCREMVEEVPKSVDLIVHNAAFEGPVLHRAWGDKWKDNGWFGFLPNVVDTMVEASYVDENQPRGLKHRAKAVLGYEQETYEQVTTMEGPLDVILPGGIVVAGPFTKTVEPAEYTEVTRLEEVEEQMVEVTRTIETKPAVTEDGWYKKQYKMCELTGRRVMNYGCDDTIVTAWLHVQFRLVMGVEQTAAVFDQVERLPMYLTNLAFVKGVRVDLKTLMDLEREDKATYQTNWEILRDYLFTQGWSGTVKPVFEDVDVAAVKQVCEIVLGEEFTTRKKKLPAVAADLRLQFPDNETAEAIALAVEQGSVVALNAFVDRHFNGEPKINFDSPRQVQKLLYGSLGMVPRIYNKLTPKERENEEMREAFSALKRLNQGRKVEVTDAMREMWQKKASTDDQAIDLALAKDDLTDDQRKVLKAYLKIKEVTTRMKMFYNTYKKVVHWSDGRIHPNFNQCATVTKRYSSSDPNLQQLPSVSGFRAVLKAHHDEAVVVSLDFNAQEIRATAHASQDQNLIGCYVGEKKQDVHSLVAVRAAPYVWGETITYEDFMAMRKSSDKAIRDKADALRKGAKATLFGSIYGIAAPKLALQLKTDEDTAQKFLDALDEAFPGVNKWKDKVTEEAHLLGYSRTFLGDRRHLAAALSSTDRSEESRAERQACNAVIQGSSAAQVKLAMSRMWSSGLFTSGEFDAEFIATIHDECVASVHRDQVVPFIREMHKHMTAPFADMCIPAVSSIAIGRDFTCPVEVGEVVDDAVILKAVQELFGGE